MFFNTSPYTPDYPDQTASYQTIPQHPYSRTAPQTYTSWHRGYQYDAVPMLLRILTEEIETVSDEEIRQVCMLVVYHDIIGDCMEKGREKQQVADVIESESSDIPIILIL